MSATVGRRKAQPGTGAALTTERVWNELEKISFAVISYVTPAGKPRSSGVLCAAARRRLYLVTAADSWKARQISDGDEVAVTVPVRRGGLLSLISPIPPATVSFHATARVHPAGPVSIEQAPKKLVSQLPRERRGPAACSNWCRKATSWPTAWVCPCGTRRSRTPRWRTCRSAEQQSQRHPASVTGGEPTSSRTSSTATERGDLRVGPCLGVLSLRWWPTPCRARAGSGPFDMLPDSVQNN